MPTDRSDAMPADRSSADPPPLETGDVPVVIVGAGPVGLALALGLSRHGVASLVLERSASTSRFSKAAAVHVRTREVLRQWGVEEPFLEAGILHPSITLHAAPAGRPVATLDLTELRAEAEAPGLLLLEQSVTERLLLEEVHRTGLGRVRFGTEVIGLTQHATGVTVTARTDQGEQRFDAGFAVGCDGASSSVRHLIGMPFRGMTYRVHPMLADVHLDDARDDLPWPRQHQGSDGLTNAIRLRPGLWRIIRLDDHAPSGSDERANARVDESEVALRVEEVLGPGSFEVVWAERFRIHRRSSPRFRRGRVVLAGDAAHIHSPLGGLGMNAGIQDAHNLAWKLAAALDGGDADRLLGSYDVERRAVVVDQISRATDVATRLFLQSPPAIREHSVGAVAAALRVGGLRRRALRNLAMIDLAYPASPLLDTAHLSAGVRLPDPVLETPEGGQVRLHRLLPDAAAVLIEVSSSPPPASSPPPTVPADIRSLRIGPGGHLEPEGSIRRLLDGDDGWILVRPDAHVAWAHASPDRPPDTWVTWSLGTPGRGTSPRPRGRASGGPITLARRLLDRTNLDLPHVR